MKKQRITLELNSSQFSTQAHTCQCRLDKQSMDKICSKRSFVQCAADNVHASDLEAIWGQCRARGEPHTRLTLKKRFTNLKVNLKRLGLYIGAKMKLVSYEVEYFYQCIMTFWGLRDSKGSILMHQVHLTLFLPAKKLTLKTSQGQNQPLCKQNLLQFYHKQIVMFLVV